MTVGVAHSGGGLTGLVAAICAMTSLNDTFPSELSGSLSTGEFAVSTSSGGTIGFGVLQNAGEKLFVPSWNASITFEDANSQLTSAQRPLWFASALNYLPDYHAARRQLRAGSIGPTESGWWIDAIDACFWLGYGVHDYNLVAGSIPWYVNFGLLKQSAAPITVDGTTGVYAAAAEKMTMGSMEMVTGKKRTEWSKFDLSDDNITVLDAMSYSSAFWAASIIESRVQYLALGNTLMPDASDKLYFLDGGFLDTTGIVALLQQNVSSIIAFYNNNNDLTTLNSSLAFLFGESTVTDSMNSLEGPELSQVFDGSVFPEIITNLTNPAILRARVEGLQVLDNDYLGTRAYTLDSLIILSNQYSSEFLATFEDDQISSSLSEEWPNQFAVGMPTLDANVLCMFNDWKIQRYADEIGAALS